MDKRRNLPLSGAKNIRDLGGIANRNGQTVRRGLFYRGGALDRLTDEDLAFLRDPCGIRTVIDLRTSAERQERTDRAIPGADMLHLPVFDGQIAGVTHERGVRIDPSALPDMGQLYSRMLCEPVCVENLKRIMAVLMDAARGPVLFHCTEGKDRTGVLSMLLLSALDVPQEAILQDYLYTNRVNAARANRYAGLILLKKRDRKLAAAVRNMLLAKQGYLESAVRSLEEQYGSVAGYLARGLGITDGEKRAFRQYALE